MTARALLVCAALAAGCASTAREAGPSSAPAGEVHAARVPDSPIVDGIANDAAWAAARETVVALEGISGPASCRIRAAVHGGSLHLLVRWEDATEDRAHKPWVRGPDGAWVAGPQREDVLSVAFPMEGKFTADMLSPVEATWDVWHWKAGRTDPAGRAMDRIHRMTFTDPGGSRYAAVLPDGRTLYIERPEDAGDPVTETLPAPPADAPAGGPRFRARPSTGSAADVAARGRWEDGTWTVEIARALASFHPDDRDLSGLESIPFALAILDREEDDAHAASGVLTLIFPPRADW